LANSCLVDVTLFSIDHMSFGKMFLAQTHLATSFGQKEFSRQTFGQQISSLLG
jgi:hypothetical protein